MPFIRYLFFFIIISQIGSCSKSALRNPAANVINSDSEQQVVNNLGNFACNGFEDTKKFKDSELSRCEVPYTDPENLENKVKNFYTLKLKGKSFPEITYAQGYLLAEQIEQGSLVEALNNLKGATASLSKPAQAAFEGMNRCILKNMKKSLTTEFNQGIEGLYAGYKKAFEDNKQTPKYTLDDLYKANYLIELGNIAGGIIYEAKKSKIKTGAKLIFKCGIYITSKVVDELFSHIVDKGILKDKFACTGAVSPNNFSKPGEGLIHARNLEQTSMINSWNNSPVIYIVDEGEKYNKYVAFGTAGLIFPGGISGFNDHGISVSLHQMNTAEYKFDHAEESAYLMPFLQQRILREARNIDDARKIIEKSKVFSSWSILISDANKNEVASFEIGAKKFVEARRYKDTPMGQSNHFVHPDMQKYHFHNRYSNYLETTGRLSYITEKLNTSKGKIDVNWMMKELASHIDPYEKRYLIFGRSIARTSNIMSSIVLPSKKEAWVTSGDMLPAIHGVYLGFKANFNDMTLTPIGMKQVQSMPERLESYIHYVNAYKIFQSSDYQATLEELNKVSQKVYDPHVEYLRGRLMISIGEYQKAFELFENLQNSEPLFHPYTKGRILIYKNYAKMMTGKNIDGYDIHELKNFEKTLEILLAQQTPDKNLFPYFAKNTHGKFDLEVKLKITQNLIKGKKNFKVDSPDISSVD